MTLQDFINKHGTAAAADKLGFKPRTISAWRWGQRIPSRESALAIVERSGGEITLEEIYAPMRDRQANKAAG